MIFSSCNNTSVIQNPDKIRIRITLASPINDKVEAKVYIEGYDGNIVNGATVFVKDSSNTITKLEYNSQQACYYNMINKQSVEEYVIIIDSILFDSPKIYTIPHTYLEETIDIQNIEIVNKLGESYQNFDTINTAYPIRITWQSAIKDCSYKVIIRTPTKVLYESSTNNKTIEIPGNTISTGTNYVYLQIQQQKSYGDIQFQNFDYYSVSIYSTENINFNIM